MENSRNEYIAKAKENLELLNARIVNLEAMANEKSGEVRRELKATLSGIRDSKEQADRRLQELKLASKPAWEDIKHGVEQAWVSLSDSVDRAAARFK